MKIKLIDFTTGERKEFTPEELLKEINRDRSEKWQDYTLEELKENLEECLSLTDWDLDDWIVEVDDVRIIP